MMKRNALILFWPTWLLAAVLIALFDPPGWVVWVEVLAPVVALVVFRHSPNNEGQHGHN